MKNKIYIQKFEESDSPIIESGCLYNDELFLKFRKSGTIYRFSPNDFNRYWENVLDNVFSESEMTDILIDLKNATDKIFKDEAERNGHKKQSFCQKVRIQKNDKYCVLNNEKNPIASLTYFKNIFNDFFDTIRGVFNNTESFDNRFTEILLIHLNDVMIYDQSMNGRYNDPLMFHNVKLKNGAEYWFYTRLENINYYTVWYPAVGPVSWSGVKSDWPTAETE